MNGHPFEEINCSANALQIGSLDLGIKILKHLLEDIFMADIYL